MANKNTTKSKEGKKVSKTMDIDHSGLQIEIIRDLFREMFTKHEENIIKIIAANNKIISDRLEKLEEKVNDIQESLEYTESELKTNINKLEEQQKLINEQMKDKLREIEDRSRRNNLRIDGIKESENENWEDTDRKVTDFFKTKLGLDNIIIERAHRGANWKRQKEMNQPRTIILKLLNFKDKERILKNAKYLKNTGIFINEDFSKETIEKRKKLWEDVIKLRKEGKYAILKYDRIYSRDFKK